MRAQVSYLADLIDEAFGCYAGLTGRVLAKDSGGEQVWSLEDWVEPVGDNPGVNLVTTFTRRSDDSVEMEVAAVDSEDENNKVVRSEVFPP